MSDFIEREPVAIFVEECGCSPKWIAERIRNQEAFPAVDVAPVVYCKDCTYFSNAKLNAKGFLVCPASGMEITEDDYCSYGERKKANT